MLLRPLKGSHHLLRDISIALGLYLVLFAVVHFVAVTERSRQAQEFKAGVIETLAALRTALEAELNANVFLANGLAAHVIAVPELEDQIVDKALRSLYRHGSHVRNVGIAPGNRITHLYPLEGNEAAIGLYYPDIPDQWTLVRRAIESRSTVLDGPVELVQGGSGLISRTPVFRQDGSYWGIVSMVFDTESLFGAVGLAPLRDGIRYALRGTDAEGANGAMILGSPALFEQQAARATVAIPGGQWILAAMPIGGWEAGSDLVLGIELAALLLSAGLSMLSFLVLRSRVELQASEHRARAFLETTRDGVIVIDDDGVIREFNSGAEAIFGYRRCELVGTSVNRLMFSDDAARHDGYLRSARAHGSAAMGSRRDLIARHKNGSAVPVEINVSETSDGAERLHIGVLRDITERKALEDQLRRQATTDCLTGVLNRRAFLEALERADDLARRHGRPLALLLLDADHFKRVNDTYGHAAGDAVLRELARIGNACLRASDRLGRIGGEEFAFLLQETDAPGAVAFAERLLAAIRATRVDIGREVPLSFTVSIGVALSNSGMKSHQTLLQCADQALYAAKSGGRDQWASYGSDVDLRKGPKSETAAAVA